MNRRKVLIAVGILLVLGSLVAYSQLTIFVIPPIGAVPEGRTVVMSRIGALQFVDSPDAVCERIQGGVSLLRRGVVMGQALKEATIYARLPYSQTLYLLSTGGKTYDR